jgi:hypothetical protein
MRRTSGSAKADTPGLFCARRLNFKFQSSPENSSGRTFVQPLSRNTAQGASRTSEADSAASIRGSHAAYSFFIFFFFFGLVAMAYFLLSVMNCGRVEFKLCGRVSVPSALAPLTEIDGATDRP